MLEKTCPLSIIIPVWNRWDLTEACLRSLREHTPGSFFEVLVVDNHSDDATVSELEPLGRALFAERFTCLRLESNTGFGPACNRTAHIATGNMLFFLNNDTLLTPNWLPPLMKALNADSRLGAVGPLLLYPDSNRVQHCGITFTPSLGTEHLYANFPANHPAVRAKRSLQAITGAAILLEKHLFEACGQFYPGYRNGFEDLELCCRIREAGRKLAVVPESTVYHLESQTPGRGDDDSANATLLTERCKGFFGPDLHRFLRRDGYVLEISPWLEPYAALPPEREEALTAALSTQFDPAACWAMLQEEPLWQTGYALLATTLEQNGQYAEASGLRLLQTYFHPMLPHFRQLAATAAKAGNLHLARQAVDRAEHVTALLEDPGPLIKKAAGLANWARKANETELQHRYEGWLRDLGVL